jgi:uncharacterized protein involved in outer membrane biogenesis
VGASERGARLAKLDPWPHVHADDIILGNPPDIPDVTMVHLPRVEATLAPLALLTKTVYLPWIKLQQPDARLIRLSEKTTTGRLTLPATAKKIRMPSLLPGHSVSTIFFRSRADRHRR